jgi:hypothetical protein
MAGDLKIKDNPHQAAQLCAQSVYFHIFESYIIPNAYIVHIQDQTFGISYPLRRVAINPLTPELNPSAQRCLPRFLIVILDFKGFTARRIYKSFCVKRINTAHSS